jgi:2',3'-cyclic-nucleotide 2'-phosphodiesterase (5'-nucleotidase family)
VHAHLDEFSSSGTDCTRPERGCYGGYARVKTIIDEQRPNYEDSLFLNAGDEFQGTLFYGYYGGEKIAETLNQLGFDAMTLGNHEFDGGDAELGEFLVNLTFPVVSANVHSQNENVNKTVKPYTIFEQYGLALIGVTAEETGSLSNADVSTVFSNTVEVCFRSVVGLRRQVTNYISRLFKAPSMRSRPLPTSLGLLLLLTLATTRTRS